MSTDGSSLGWSDLLDSRPLSSSSDETTVHMSPKQTPAMTQLSRTLLTEEPLAPSLDDLTDKLPENLNVKDTYVIYSVGNATLLMGSLDPKFATDHQLELLDRHLLDVKIADPEEPLWPNPDVLTMGMRNLANGDVPCTSSAAASASTTNRRCHSKMKSINKLGKKQRTKLHYK